MHSKRNIIELLELCVIKNSDAAWREFIMRYATAIQGIYFKQDFTIKDDDVFHKFKLWFPGWLYYGNKIQAAYRALIKKIDKEGLSSPEEQEKYFAVYFSKIIKSGCAEFGREKKETYNALEVKPDLPDTNRATTNLFDDGNGLPAQVLFDALKKLSPDQRVPFLLRYYDLVWPLEEQDMQWAAAQTRITVDDFSKAVEDEGCRQAQKKFPISSKFVGELLNIPADVNGKYVTVDQRVRRVLLKLKSAVLAAGEEVEQ